MKYIRFLKIYIEIEVKLNVNKPKTFKRTTEEENENLMQIV